MQTQTETTVHGRPLLMSFARIDEDVKAFILPDASYDPFTQVSKMPMHAGSSERSGCTKATYSTPEVGKDPEGDYAADD
jgi:hypothetical protein